MSQRASFIFAFIVLFVVHFSIGMALTPSNDTSELAGSQINLFDHIETLVLALALPALVLGLYKLFIADNVQDQTVRLSVLGCGSLVSVLFLYYVLK